MTTTADAIYRSRCIAAFDSIMGPRPASSIDEVQPRDVRKMEKLWGIEGETVTQEELDLALRGLKFYQDERGNQ